MIELPARHGQLLDAYYASQGDSNDCGPHAVAMTVNYWHGEARLDASTLAREMNRPRFQRGFPPIVIRRVPGWATFPWGMVDALRQNGVAARWRFMASEDVLRRAISEGRPVLPVFGEPLRRDGWRFAGWGHVAVLVGWDEVRLWFVDSSHPGPRFARPREDFLRQWRNLGRLVVEVLA